MKACKTRRAPRVQFLGKRLGHGRETPQKTAGDRLADGVDLSRLRTAVSWGRRCARHEDGDGDLEDVRPHRQGPIAPCNYVAGVCLARST